MTEAQLRANIARAVRAFERRIERASAEDQRALRAELREERGVYYVRSYTVRASFRRLPKRGARR